MRSDLSHPKFSPDGRWVLAQDDAIEAALSPDGVSFACVTPEFEARVLVEANPGLKARFEAMDAKQDDVGLLELLDLASGQTRGHLLIDFGNDSFRLGPVVLAAGTVVVNDNRNRTLAYSLATGKQTGGAAPGSGQMNDRRPKGLPGCAGADGAHGGLVPLGRPVQPGRQHVHPRRNQGGRRAGLGRAAVSEPSGPPGRLGPPGNRFGAPGRQTTGVTSTRIPLMPPLGVRWASHGPALEGSTEGTRLTGARAGLL